MSTVVEYGLKSMNAYTHVQDADDDHKIQRLPLTMPVTAASGLHGRHVGGCYSTRWNASLEHLAVASNVGRLQFWCAHMLHHAIVTLASARRHRTTCTGHNQACGCR